MIHYPIEAASLECGSITDLAVIIVPTGVCRSILEQEHGCVSRRGDCLDVVHHWSCARMCWNIASNTSWWQPHFTELIGALSIQGALCICVPKLVPRCSEWLQACWRWKFHRNFLSMIMSVQCLHPPPGIKAKLPPTIIACYKRASIDQFHQNITHASPCGLDVCLDKNRRYPC